MNKLDFDGRLLEGKNVEKKIRDIANEMIFSGDEREEQYLYNIPKKVYPIKRKSFYSY